MSEHTLVIKLRAVKLIVTPADVERFWSYVDKAGPVPAHQPELGPCWTWTAATVHGYGQLNISKRFVRAHRLSFVIHHHTIPRGKDICHHCDNRSCVRPDHLFAGTHSDNMRDCSRKGRIVVPEIKAHGETHVRAKLTQAQVEEIRHRLSRGEFQRIIAADFGVDQSNISHIKRGRNWGHS